MHLHFDSWVHSCGLIWFKRSIVHRIRVPISSTRGYLDDYLNRCSSRDINFRMKYTRQKVDAGTWFQTSGQRSRCTVYLTQVCSTWPASLEMGLSEKATKAMSAATMRCTKIWDKKEIRCARVFVIHELLIVRTCLSKGDSTAFH